MKDSDPDETINQMLGGIKGKRPFPISDELIHDMKTHTNPDIQAVGNLMVQVKLRDQEIMKQMDVLTDLLGYLRVLVKYQTFDLEATRRERNDLRMLEDD